MRILTGLIYAVVGVLAIALLLASTMAWPPRLGIELGGSVQMVFQVDRNNEETEEHWDRVQPQLFQALTARLDPSGSREVIVRPHGLRKVEIQVPYVDVEEIDSVLRRITTAGVLTFHIVAKRSDMRHQAAIEVARTWTNDAERQLALHLKDESDKVVGHWARANRLPITAATVGSGREVLSVYLGDAVIRDANTGELLELPTEIARMEPQDVARYFVEQGIEEVDLLLVDDGYGLTGSHMTSLSASYDEHLNPCVNFRLNEEGVALMWRLSGENLPDLDTQSYQCLAIVLDDRVITAPRLITQIGDSGRITGDLTLDEVNFLVSILRAGRLPVALQERPLSEKKIPPDVKKRNAISGAGVALAVLLLAAWVLLVLRYGLIGLGGALTNALQASCLVAAPLLVNFTITLPLLWSAAGIVLVTLTGIFGMCELLRRAGFREKDKPRAIGRSLLLTALPLAVLMAALWIGGVVGYAIGGFAVRSIAVPAVLGSTVALGALPLCLSWPIVRLISPAPVRC